MMSHMTDNTAAPTTPAYGVVESISKYVAAEGGSAKAVLQPAGAAGVRITLVGEQDGDLADRVVPTLEEARRIVDGIEGLEVAEWDRDLTNKATVQPSHWRQMAGWVAGSHRFPKARNRKVVDYR
ncbi:hypothetical protein MUG78_14370 [Gordonia alkaliphila]|nr:hypothetical protein [Gordonia alkaliphila]MCK0440604.1 hypothetical protein [Gordonia alkaliphila]